MASRDYFNTYGTEPTYKDPDTLRKFITPRGKIVDRDKSRLTARNQRKLSKAIKQARYLGLLPYTSYQQEKLQQNERK